MKGSIKQAIALIAVLIITAGMMFVMTSCGESSEEGNTGSSDGITIFNSKMEIQDQMLQMAERYTEQTGVPVEIYYSADTVSAHLATKYASGNPYTLSMVDAKDVYSLAEEHAVDMSDQDWVKDTQYAIDINDKVYGFPVCIEARGIIYNKDAIEKTTGKKFKPKISQTYTAFCGLIEELKKGGMESPPVS